MTSDILESACDVLHGKGIATQLWAILTAVGVASFMAASDGVKTHTSSSSYAVHLAQAKCIESGRG